MLIEVRDLLSALWADFLQLKPTEQVSWVVAVGGAVLGIAFFVFRALGRSETKPRHAETTPLSREEIFRLIATGEATVGEATELARALYSNGGHEVAARNGASINTSHGAGQAGSLEADPVADDDEERRAFTAVITELATSDTESDRDVVLSYARGNHGAAIAALESRARAAGDQGAAIWREAAILARPRDLERSIEAFRKVVALDPGDVGAACQLARTLSMADRPQEAVDVANQAFEQATNSYFRARALIRQSQALQALGKLEEAQAKAIQAVAEARRAAGEDPHDRKTARALGNAFERLAAAQSTGGFLVDASQSADNAFRVYQALLKDDPEDEDSVLEMGSALGRKAALAGEMGDLENATALYSELVEHSERAHDASPSNLWLASELADAYRQLGYCKKDNGDFDAAFQLAEKCEALCERTLAKDRVLVSPRRILISCGLLRARLHRAAGEFDTEEEVLSRLRRLAEEQARSETEEALSLLGLVWFDIGDAARAQGSLDAAQDAYTRAYDLFSQIADANPRNVDRREYALFAVFRIGSVASDKGDFDEYEARAEKILEQSAQLCRDNPASWKARRLKAHAMNLCRHVAALRNRPDDMLSHGRQALSLFSELHHANASNLEAETNMLSATRVLADDLLSVQQLDEAERLSDDALKRAEALVERHPHSYAAARELFLMRDTRAVVFAQIGRARDALQLVDNNVEWAHRMYERAPRSRQRRSDLSHIRRHRAELLASLEQAEAALEEISKAESLLAMAGNETYSSDKTEAVVLKSKRATLLSTLGRVEEAQEIQDEAFRLSEDCARNTSDAQAQRNFVVAIGHRTWKQLAEADGETSRKLIADYETALARVEGLPLFRRSSEIYALEMRLALALREIDTVERMRVLEEIVERADENAAANPRALDRLREQISARSRLMASLNHEEPGKAQALAADLESKIDRLDRDFPEAVSASLAACEAWMRLSQTLLSLGQVEKALNFARHTEKSAESLSERTSAVGVGLTRCVNARLQVVECLLCRDDRQEAVRVFTRIEQDFAAFPDPDAIHKSDLFATYLLKQVRVMLTSSRLAEADNAMTQAQSLIADRYAQTRAMNHMINLMTIGSARVSGALFRDQPGIAIAAATEVDNLCRERLAEITNTDVRRRVAALAEFIVAQANIADGNLETARAAIANARASTEKDLQDRNTVDDLRDVVATCCLLGDLERGHGNIDGARESYERSLELSLELREKAPELRLVEWQEVELRLRLGSLEDGTTQTDIALEKWRSLTRSGREPMVDSWVREFGALHDS